MVSSFVTYPIKFSPILKQKIWGGNKLVKELGKESSLANIGESWELSGVEGDVSEVINGVYASKKLSELLKVFKDDLVGSKVYSKYEDNFPLLFKFIDAADNLSIQLHPKDDLAKKRHNCLGKTEMWYVINADKDAKLYAGFSKVLNKELYLTYFNKGELLDVVIEEEVKKDDSFFIEAGTIHAIGRGVLLAEIQQTSDITYRVYDWDRAGVDGKKRDLHTDLAIDAYDFSKNGSCKLDFSKELNRANQVFSCDYFTTNRLELEIDYTYKKEISNIDSFVVYMCLEGAVEFVLNGFKESVVKGETVLIPAASSFLEINSKRKSKLLEVYI